MRGKGVGGEFWSNGETKNCGLDSIESDCGGDAVEKMRVLQVYGRAWRMVRNWVAE